MKVAVIHPVVVPLPVAGNVHKGEYELLSLLLVASLTAMLVHPTESAPPVLVVVLWRGLRMMSDGIN